MSSKICPVCCYHHPPPSPILAVPPNRSEDVKTFSLINARFEEISLDIRSVLPLLYSNIKVNNKETGIEKTFRKS